MFHEAAFTYTRPFNRVVFLLCWYYRCRDCAPFIRDSANNDLYSVNKRLLKLLEVEIRKEEKSFLCSPTKAMFTVAFLRFSLVLFAPLIVSQIIK